jgi:hypothetical protein
MQAKWPAALHSIVLCLQMYVTVSLKFGSAMAGIAIKK